MTRRRLYAVVVFVVTAVGLGVLMRRGVVQFLDAGSYAAGIDAIAHGRGLQTSLAPSFSNFSVIEFTTRGARIPFVDFPLGYPLVAAVPAVVVGARRAMLIVAVVSAALMVTTVALGPRRARVVASNDLILVGLRWLMGLGLVCLPMFEAIIRGGLSEPLFCLLLVIALKMMLDAQADLSKLRWALFAAGAAGAVRFVGLPIVAIPAWLMLQQAGWRKTAPWAIAAIAPATMNVAWAGFVGSGHVAGVRQLSAIDLRFAVHSISGWLDHRRGVFNLLLSGSNRPPIWVYAVALCWLVAVTIAFTGLIRRRPILPTSIELSLALAGTLTAGLFAGMLLFDSLVSPDNRLMLPAGVITIVGIGWWAIERYKPATCAAALAVWIVTAVAPWQLDRAQPTPVDQSLISAVGDAKMVISDNADSVWWQTGTPAAYLPLPRRLLTEELVDQRGELAALPCLLAAQDGVIVIVGGPFVDQSAVTTLEELVVDGVLQSARFGANQVFTPTGQGC